MQAFLDTHYSIRILAGYKYADPLYVQNQLHLPSIARSRTQEQMGKRPNP